MCTVATAEGLGPAMAGGSNVIDFSIDREEDEECSDSSDEEYDDEDEDEDEESDENNLPNFGDQTLYNLGKQQEGQDEEAVKKESSN
jgi:hypothetical protein